MSLIQKRAERRLAIGPRDADPWVPRHTFSACLRVGDVGARHDEICRVTGLVADEVHLAGEPDDECETGVWSRDLWSLESPLPREEPLSAHLAWLWTQVGPHVDYVRSLIVDGAAVDIFCGYISDCDHCGFDLDPGAMRLADALGVTLGMNTIFVGRG